MGGRVNDGTKHLFWQLSFQPYSANVRVRRDYRTTVSVEVSNNGFMMAQQLEPHEAREMAEALIELAKHAEEDLPTPKGMLPW